VARAAKNILGDKLESIYIVGGVAEDRITVYSDIDIVIIVRDPGLKSLDN
jgi:predicted nucleotidyltransferase